MTDRVNILLTGVTGYIGGTVLRKFLEHPSLPLFNITAIVRSAPKAEKLKALGINVAVGSHDDGSLVETLAADSDVVIAMADSDNLEAARAILRGLKKRREVTKTIPILIHTSGTSVLSDDAHGAFATQTIYDDSNPDQIESLPDTQMHRNVDLEIVRADKEGYLKSYIIMPSTIWGMAKGILVEQGIQNRHSVQVPHLIRVALQRGRAGMVGEGKNIWPDVNLEELTDLYLLLFNTILTDPNTPHGREGYYFGESDEHTLYEVGKAIGEALVELGKSDNAEPSSFTKEEQKGLPDVDSNSRCRATRSRSIGWKPVKTKKDFLESIKPEVAVIAKEVGR